MRVPVPLRRVSVPVPVGVLERPRDLEGCDADQRRLAHKG